MNRLEIHDLYVRVGEKTILKGINLEIPEGESHILFGPNGCGKTSLLMSIIGYPEYKITKGKIIYKGKDITNFAIDERAREGIGISFQKPPSVKGVTLRKILNTLKDGETVLDGFIGTLKMEEYLDRDINLGFSGGEVKRSELLQLIYQNPDFVMFDEPESGVDVENIRIIGNVIKKFLYPEKTCSLKQCQKSALLITHTGFIMDYINTDKAYVMMEGEVLCSGNPEKIFSQIQKCGFKECTRCQ